jgi:hypothetical protein
MRQTDWHVPKLTGAHLGATTIGGNEPLSLALSPLRWAGELANCIVLVSRRARLTGVGVFCAALAALSLQAAPSISSVTKNPETVDKYAKLELTVGLTAAYTNAYDPDQIDLSAEFTAPSGKVWKVNGFYDGALWKVRFAANETGNWKYVVGAKDAQGTAASPAGTFACAPSPLHGWVRAAPNKRYLCCDDGTSFYGVGVCHAWSVTPQTLDQMKALGFNTYVYWNGTYDSAGGNNLIESMSSGIGKYDQGKCARLDNLINWSADRGIGMILVIWPHDYLCENKGDMGTWPSKWTLNPYSRIVPSTNFYSDTNAWAYQAKMYRYIIARWGYSVGLEGWQVIDEIEGTSGGKHNKAAGDLWTAKIASFFQTNDPFKHPTTASLGGFWDEGDKANDLPNTEHYGSSAPATVVNVVRRLWNGYTKPCIIGESALDRTAPAAHQRLWSSLAAGISITPLLWQFSQGWNQSAAAQYPAFNKFIADINFGALANPTLAKVSVPDVGAWGITSDQITFGWVTGDLGAPGGRRGAPATPAPPPTPISGKSLAVSGLRDGAYRMEWWDCATGAVISTKTVTAANGAVTAEIPATSQTDLAFKIIR